MDSKVNVLNDNERELEVKLNYDEIKEEIDQAYKKERKKISLPGFRKGKVPIQMLKKLYGEAIEYQASEEIANKKFWDAVNELNLKPVSAPTMTDFNFEINKKLEFKVKYEIKPEIDVKDYKGLEIEKPVFKVNDEDIDKEVNLMLKSKADFVEADKIEDENYRITVDLQRLDDESKEIENNKSEGVVVDLSDPQVNNEIVENAKGKKLGETFSFSFSDEREVDGKKEKENFIYKAKITKIEKIELPEVSEEIIEEISNKKAKTLDEFKDQLKTRYQEYYNQQSESIYENSLFAKIIENNEYEPSDSFIDTVYRNLVEMEKENAQRYNQPFNEEAVKDNLRKRAVNTAKWQVITENIARIEKIEVTDEDLKEMAEKEAEKTGIAVDKLISFYKNSNRHESLIEEKVVKFLKENNKVKEIDPKEKSKEREKDK